MDDRAEHQHEDERNVQDMPKREQPLVGAELRDLLQLAHVALQYSRSDAYAVVTLAPRPAVLGGLARQDPPDLAHAAPVGVARAHGERHEAPYPEQPEPRLVGRVRLEVLEPLLHARREMELRLQRFALEPEVILTLAQRRLPAVEAVVDLGVDEAADDAAARHDQHAVERDRGVERLDLERRVIEDQHRSGDPQEHVDPEPDLEVAGALQELEALAQRIQE